MTLTSSGYLLLMNFVKESTVDVYHFTSLWLGNDDLIYAHKTDFWFLDCFLTTLLDIFLVVVFYFLLLIADDYIVTSIFIFYILFFISIKFLWTQTTQTEKKNKHNLSRISNQLTFLTSFMSSEDFFNNERLTDRTINILIRIRYLFYFN